MFKVSILNKTIIATHWDIERQLKKRIIIALPRRSRVDAIFLRFFNCRSMALCLFGGFRVDLDPLFGGLKSARNPKKGVIEILASLTWSESQNLGHWYKMHSCFRPFQPPKKAMQATKEEQHKFLAYGKVDTARKSFKKMQNPFQGWILL